MIVRCPAKVNLFLSVGSPDASGYHSIRTVFQAVSLADELTIERSEEDVFGCSADWVPSDNTVTKTWRLAREYVDLPRLRVQLTKRIPAQSGLGGGSSDAAGFLRALETLTQGSFSTANAKEVAMAVGADVPFFLVGGCAVGEGRGERVTPLPERATKWLVIAMPCSESVSTQEAYRALDAVPHPWLDFPPDPWCPLVNDFRLVSPIASREAEQELASLGAETTGLSGSGAAVFGVFPSEDAAMEASQAAGESGWLEAWPCRTLTREESLWTS
jgi:4-diphosphocytidyl-2-C-methyl-D-erythritol kinase